MVPRGYLGLEATHAVPLLRHCWKEPFGFYGGKRGLFLPRDAPLVLKELLRVLLDMFQWVAALDVLRCCC